MLARPLIEEWMEQNLGPEARVRFAVEGIATAINALPSVVEGLERSANMISNGQVRLHPETIKQLRGESNKRGLQKVLLFVAACILMIILVIH